jgi:bifunctional non-homologous end joining protein LigD
MALEEYWKKRKFEKTPEPKGKVKITGKSRFVVHDHYAEKAGHHHDFRLEMEGGFKKLGNSKIDTRGKRNKEISHFC